MTRISTKNFEQVRAIALSDRTMRRAAKAWENERSANCQRRGFVITCIGENAEAVLRWWSAELTTAKRIANTHYMKNKGRDTYYYNIVEVGNGEVIGLAASSK